MRQMQLDTDCEGPLALNDNAFEVCRDFITPEGDRFFTQVSRYDDFLADIGKPADYVAVTTLKLILPFLKAYGLTNALLRDYSLKTMKLVPGVEGAYKFLKAQDFPIFEISTSYRQFAEAVGVRLGFDPGRIYSTELDLDRYTLSPGEAAALKVLKDEIAGLPGIELPPEAASLQDLPGPTQEAIHKLDRIFKEKVPALDIGVIYQEVNPVGGSEKARALSDSVAQTGVSLADAIYVGDSITDVQAFEAVRAGGGLSVSFNGNRYAVNAAEVMVVADNAWPIALIAAIFQLWGKEGVLEVATGGAKSLVLPEKVIEPLSRGLEGRNFNLYHAGSPDLDAVARESTAMRSRLRGEDVAALG